MNAMTEQVQTQVLQIAVRRALPQAGFRYAYIMKLFLQNCIDWMSNLLREHRKSSCNGGTL